METSIVHKVLNWNEEKYNDLIYEEECPKTYVKAFGCGALDGLIDGLVIVGLVTEIALVGKLVKSAFTKK